MIYDKFGWNWSTGSGEEDENLKSLQRQRQRQRRRRTTDTFWSEKLTWVFGSGELKTWYGTFLYLSEKYEGYEKQNLSIIFSCRKHCQWFPLQFFISKYFFTQKPFYNISKVCKIVKSIWIPVFIFSTYNWSYIYQMRLAFQTYLESILRYYTINLYKKELKKQASHIFICTCWIVRKKLS